MFQVGPAQRFAPQQTSPFQNASSSNPAEITFPTAPVNHQPPPAFQGAAPSPATYPQQTPAESSYRIGDEEGPQLLPPATE
jgi:hypothetical protein